MTAGELFYKTIEAHWYEWKEKDRKNPKYVKVLNPDFVNIGADSAFNVSIFLVDHKMNIGNAGLQYNKLKSFKHATATLSYYKLFNNCTIVEDEEKIKQLTSLEAKLLLIGR